MTAIGKERRSTDVGDLSRVDFGIDSIQRTTGDAIREYFRNVRGGELGSLPALFGLLIVAVLFWQVDSSGVFTSMLNIGNLLQQGAGQTIIAMGLVYVLLIGEIDLAAGTASGVTVALMALYLQTQGNLLGSLGGVLFTSIAAGMLVCAVLAALCRVWAGAVAATIGALMLIFGLVANPWLAILLAVCFGIAIGSLTGFLVAKLGIPSFVASLPLFIAWQGLILQITGTGGSIGLRDPVIFNIANGSLSILNSWILCILAAGGYAIVKLLQYRSSRSKGLVTDPLGMVLIKVGAVIVLSVVATWLLTQNRSPSEDTVIAGIPIVVPIVLVLLVAGTYVLDRTRFGRHVYAVGGNREAARRAGVDVSKIRASVFVISGGFAAVGAIVYSSKVGSVSPSSGGGNTLLFAIGAAVIGGVSLFGGRGRLSNAVVGGALLATVQNGLGLLKQPAAVVFEITGLLLLLAAAVDVLARRRSAATGTR